MSSLLKNLLFVLGFILVAGAGYYMYSTQSIGELDIRGVAALDASVVQNTEVFIERRETLNSLNLGTDLFDDPRFTNLRTFTTPVPQQPVGRVNPFLPPDTTATPVIVNPQAE